MVKRALLACFLLAALLVPAHGASETEVKTQVLALPVLAAALIVGIVLFRKKKRPQKTE